MADYSVNYNDKRFQNVETEKRNKLNEVNSMYDGMINNSDKHYNELIQASKDYANTQSKNQQERIDFAIKEINQQKDKTTKDYTREQMGAYTDWQKQSNQYGANAEALASKGLQNSGYSESSQVNMYNTYQNRVMQARETYEEAILKYNNSITEARLSNNEALAEIAYNALQTRLKLALESFQYKNTLLESKLSTQMTVDNNYYQRYQDVLTQINHENQFKYQQERDRIADAQWQKQYNLSVSKAKSSSAKKSNSGVEVKVDDTTANQEGYADKLLSDMLNMVEVAKNNSSGMTTQEKAQQLIDDSYQKARDIVYSVYKKGNINEEQAKNIYKRLQG